MATFLRHAILILVALVTLVSSAPSANAGWGHRWGSYWGWGGYHWHHNHWGYRPVYGLGWPGYSTTSVYVGLPRYRLFHPRYNWGYARYYAPSVTYSVSVPTYYYAPTTYYYVPSCTTTYIAPTYVAPVSYPTYYDPCVYSADVRTDVPTLDPQSYSTGIVPGPLSTSPAIAKASTSTLVDSLMASHHARAKTGSPLKSNAIDSTLAAHGVRVVSTLKPSVVQTADISRGATFETVPPILLDAADQIFVEGRYAQAAAAYARLAVRYGNHDQLAVRRFIALVASGDHNQAAVVFELAEINQQSMTSESLPGRSLSSLYGAASSNKTAHMDALASFAMKFTDDPVALAMVGKWLELDDQAERAKLFIERAAQLKGSTSTPESSSSASGTLALVTP